jgi:hypothetical protein
MNQPDRRIDLQKFDRRMATEATPPADLTWRDPTAAPFALCGFPWFSTDRLYRRLPLKPTHPLPEAVDGLANHTAGGQVRFRTDARDVSVRVALRSVADMHHMAPTGQCGFDCYVGPVGLQRYVGTSIYNQRKQSYEARVLDASERAMRDVTLNFPLYQGVDELWIGLDPGATVENPTPFRLPRPVIVYGTSITQGGCASRPGMAYTNILSRRLNIEIVNLGFSGSGRGEPEVARVIAGLPEPAAIVLDFEGNCPDPALLHARLPVFIRILREAYAAIPILVLPKPPCAEDVLRPQERLAREARRDLQRRAVADLRAAGDANLWFDDIANPDYEDGTVDGTHPNDLGFIRLADAIEPPLRRVLGLAT